MSSIINITTNLNAAPKFTADNINHYTTMDFKKVCKVNENSGKWYYSEIDKDIMFADHRSWVYVITLSQIIVKAGETEQPLGIKGSRNCDPKSWEIQPITGTRSRLGRYRNGDGTDRRIREHLYNDIKKGKTVEIYAYKCPIVSHVYNINGKLITINSAVHKGVEKSFLDYFVENTGSLPILNPTRA